MINNKEETGTGVTRIRLYGLVIEVVGEGGEGRGSGRDIDSIKRRV